MASSTAPVTKKWLETNGYKCVTKTEHLNPFARRRVDLWGIADFACVDELGRIVLVQTTSASNKSSHVNKIKESEFYKHYDPNYCSILLITWKKEQISAKRFKLVPTVEDL